MSEYASAPKQIFTLWTNLLFPSHTDVAVWSYLTVHRIGNRHFEDVYLPLFAFPGRRTNLFACPPLPPLPQYSLYIIRRGLLYFPCHQAPFANLRVEYLISQMTAIYLPDFLHFTHANWLRSLEGDSKGKQFEGL